MDSFQLPNLPGIAIPSIVAAVAVLVAHAMGLFNFKNHMPVDGKTVLLTGASEGMGRSIALQLAAKGANLIVVARTAARLEALVEELKAAAKSPERQRFTYLAADVSQEDYASPLVKAATEWNDNRAPDICWCVAGLATPGLFAETPFSAIRNNTNVNFFGTAELAHAILRTWLAPDAPTTAQLGGEPRHLVMTSTVAAFFPCVGYSPYAPSKAAVRGLADVLSQEVLLYPEHKVEVHLVMPGSMTSPGLERENLTKPEITRKIEDVDPVVTPEVAAQRAIAGLERGEYLVVVAWLGYVMRWAALAGSVRNSWLIDTFMGMIMPIVWCFVLPDIFGTIRKYAKKYRHPQDHPKPGS